MSTLSHIVIIGAGQIGSRHLQALALVDRPICVSVVDPNGTALELSRTRLAEVPGSGRVSVKYLSGIEEIDSAVDVAIIATGADIRRSVVEQFLRHIHVRYIILEKVAFQSVLDFEAVMGLFTRAGIKGWVNCSYRRSFPFYKDIKSKLVKGEKVFLDVRGGGWGMACNSIHFLDLFAYLTGRPEFSLNSELLDRKVYASKRTGFFELSGLLQGFTLEGSVLSLRDDPGSASPYVVDISSKGLHVTVFESAGEAVDVLKSRDGVFSTMPFQSLRQSQMTNLVVQDILQTGDCELAPLPEAYILHKEMLACFLPHFNRVTGLQYDRCPIT